MLRELVAFLLLVLLASCGQAAGPLGKQPTPGEDSWRQLHRMLDLRITAKFSGMPLAEVVRRLRQETRVRIVVDSYALDEVGVGLDEPVSADFKDVKLVALLDRIGKPLELTWTYRNDAIVLTSKEHAACELLTRVYPVADLLGRRVSAYQGADYDTLIDTIVSTVVSATWAENGGGEAEVRPFPPAQALVISQTARAHLMIEFLLEEIRRVARQQGIALAPRGRAPGLRPRRPRPKSYLSSTDSWRRPRVYRKD